MQNNIELDTLRSMYQEHTRRGEFVEAEKIARRIIGLDSFNHKSYELAFHAYRKQSLYLEAYNIVSEGLNVIGDNALLKHLKKSAEKDIQRTVVFQSESQKPEKVVPYTCDVITMASNEGPYIADFLFHYIYHGFSNIYVAINDSSKDSTLTILEKISKVYPQVHIVDSNKVDSRFEQYSQASYGVLWEQAKKTSHSAYSLVVDIDEFLVLPKGMTNISNYLEGCGEFDALYFTYIDQTGCDDNWSLPFKALNPTLAFSKWTKYVVSNTSNLLELKPHSPVFNLKGEMPRLLLSDAQSERQVHNENAHILVVEDKLNNEEYEKVQFSEHPFIVHYRGRSEIEYSMRCIQSWPGLPIVLYPNRQGFRVPSAPIEKQKTHIALVENAVADKYFAQLDRFKVECGVSPHIEKDRKAIDESSLINALEKIDDDVLVKEKETWRRTFSNTKFIEYLESRISR